MNTDIIQLAELLSAYAALLTVGLAALELSSRNKAKKAENAIEIYADFLWLSQKVRLIEGDFSSFSKKFQHYSYEEIKTFACTHIIDYSLFDIIYNIEKNSICNMEYHTTTGKQNGAIILEYTSSLINVLENVNTFYSLIRDNVVQNSVIENFAKNISDLFVQLTPKVHAVETVFRENLKSSRSSSIKYLVFLLCSSCVFLVICFIL